MNEPGIDVLMPQTTVQRRIDSGVVPNWVVEGDREWVQYLFSEDEQKSPDECPIRIIREHPKSIFLTDA